MVEPLKFYSIYVSQRGLLVYESDMYMPTSLKKEVSEVVEMKY